MIVGLRIQDAGVVRALAELCYFPPSPLARSLTPPLYPLGEGGGGAYAPTYGGAGA